MLLDRQTEKQIINNLQLQYGKLSLGRSPLGLALTLYLREVSGLIESRGNMTTVVLKLNLFAISTHPPHSVNLYKTAKTGTL